MSDNPLEDDPARDQRIRERAYHLWESEGRPHGGEAEYWERARVLVGMADSAGSAQRPADYDDGSLNPGGLPIEEASIQANLGEFPDRLSDQGEHSQTPSRDNLKP